MINTQTLARPYAKAAFEFASAAGTTESWSKMLNLAAIAVEVPEVAALLNDPRLTSESKVQGLVRLLGDDADEAFRNYVQTLGENDRLSVLPTVWELYEDIKAQAEKTLEAEVETAFELSNEQLQTLAAALSKRLDRTVNLQQAVNPALIGGVLIRAGDVVVDGSVRGKLSQLAESLKS
ncbi:F0F1 ATP synthase subunit delta [Stutzerimonas kunmingensis]|jgi:F-type H+-transporting ATPase subunit delta|uniref:ATP synthase subunit delta n=6 Tax=Stutzerimonas stutzeri subgroup TaxID=578833 RepID=A0A0D7ECI2_STUST|nr:MULTISPECIES: F0F1 ATP synthase subunit delta [Stutzerimonas stutzeri group]KJS26378.1 MAG: ATP synthase F0F1 subunit delta [Pseudomonas sp. BRH_c35]MAF87075.1 F0F1 ATP synthase subunit delta [Pseudomonas sp.]MBU0562220.1 F0F1 ATP synthase subunit delta [Gammaproteobacteria bacterium]MCB4796795.1 F0F1 ATP synthase subunit delta [Pseudomonas sp. NP21570]OCX93938.1 MAG: F0F1 ATP synthase subunit delta [Pseudomonas sp. K35]OHC13587.1 MAG: F0F1 ATP synthase subunit delta [Pseudomonadales bacte|tara:strand:- start:11 stop:547 length:537 start_codon:yes stop_codon:yes gene_type:complete